ncbi:hypothetical protein [Photobacterium damselae]|uniref:hypothetical protein n=1 Tax=Photobacterium damselae TaxID=38293 RepID=UPI0025428470
MIILKEKIKSNFVILKNGDTQIGCGFIVPVDDYLYCITAGHVPFGRKFDKKIDVTIYDIKNNPILDFELITDVFFAKKYDLSVYKISSEIENINNVVICESILNSKLISLSYIKATSILDPYFLNMLIFNDKLSGNKTRYEAKPNSFNNFDDDRYGADAMEGISGSPILLCTDNNEIIFHGVIYKVPNKGIGDLLDVSDLMPLKEIVDGISIKSRRDFYSSHRLVTFSDNLKKEDKFKLWVNEWKEHKNNENFYENLESKLKVIYGDDFESELAIELEKIMIGSECFKRIIEKESVLYDSYNEIVKTAERQTMKKYVDSQREAFEHYQSVYESHLIDINEDLCGFQLSRTDRKKIAQYNVATWLAVCYLRFNDD